MAANRYTTRFDILAAIRYTITPGKPGVFLFEACMDLLHSTWFWVLMIVAPVGTVIATLARMSRKTGDGKLPPGVLPGTYAPSSKDGSPYRRPGEAAPAAEDTPPEQR